MSKALAAACSADGTVTVSGKEIEAVILGEGTKASTGVVILQGGTAYYIASNATDIKDVITKLVSIVNKVATTLTAIGGGMTGPTTAPPPTLGADVTEIQTLKSELQAIKDTLK